MAEISDENVILWLLSLPESLTLSDETKKRKTEQQMTPPTTPRNMEGDDMNTPRKRARQIRQSEHLELTPRPRWRIASACSTSSSSQAPVQSRSPSPLRRHVSMNPASYSDSFRSMSHIFPLPLICYNTSEDIGYAQALRELSKRTPSLTVNHTDFAALQLHILVVGIEVKKRGGKPEAKPQMGTWHGVQWAFLRWVALAALQRNNPDEDSAMQEEQADENLSQLPYLSRKKL
ncbi:hypothetical protein NOR_07828 [Metarhizium rileyi]|uniref:PD-(D/E)XK nuclease-like domain-containing protein n=1 Tax=Metarhizium rileyi (strain RCEF 4871) TaxID=1649241 RepID=A0A166XHA1_METRR|nr:hypothetical protein NOR_07828 [Metarhizium rileyi RCEF 4871]